MTEYNFVLKYRLSDDDKDADALVERLGEAGCTDALVGIGIVGRLSLDFTREADNAVDAIRSALEDVKVAIPSAILVEATPDLVGLTDVADAVAVARQSIRKLMMGHPDFPLPVHEGSTSIWHLSDVLNWLDGRKGYKLDPVLCETAAAARDVNIVRNTQRYPVSAPQKLERLIA